MSLGMHTRGGLASTAWLTQLVSVASAHRDGEIPCYCAYSEVELAGHSIARHMLQGHSSCLQRLHLSNEMS